MTLDEKCLQNVYSKMSMTTHIIGSMHCRLPPFEIIPSLNFPLLIFSGSQRERITGVPKASTYLI